MTDEGRQRREETILLLRATTDYKRTDELVVAVRPPLASACAPGRRLILEGDLQQTFLVDGAAVSSASGWPHITIRRARPIVDVEYVARLFEP